MIRILTAACVSLVVTTSAVFAGSLQYCTGATEQRIEVVDVRKCERIAVKRKMSQRQRSQIYLRLAFTNFFGAAPANVGKDSKTMSEVFRLAKSSIAIDNTYGDAYLALADFYQYKNMAAEATMILKKGLANAPENVVLQAEYAAHAASPENKAEIEKLCVKAAAIPTKDMRPYYACGLAAKHSGLLALAEIYLYKAMINHKPGGPGSKNDILFGTPTEEYMKLLFEQGRIKEAAKTLESLFADQPLVPLPDLIFLANMQQQAGEYEKAAKNYGLAASNPLVNDRFALKLKQVVLLARAGKSDQSLELAARLFNEADQQQVLALQVRLKNGSQKDLAITGKFDNSTKNALSACIKERGCFEGVAGQPI